MLKALFENIVDNAPDIPILKQIFIICETTMLITIAIGIAFGLLYGLVWVVHAMWLSF